MFAKLIAALFICLNLCSSEQVLLQTFYGPYVINEPLLIASLASASLARLRYVRQYGLDYYVIKKQEYSRWDHSIGVMVLLRRFGATVLEQAAGLWHDATHTIFSHVGDWVFSQLSPHASYQDTFFDEIMTMHGVNHLLSLYGLTVHDINPHNGTFHMLENELPDLCADRLEYNLQGGYLEGILTHEQINRILDDLCFDEGVWYFTNEQSAYLFAQVPIFLSLHVWQSPQGMLVDYLGARLVRLALEKKVISLMEVHTAYDDAMWQRICQAPDVEIQQALILLREHQQAYVQVDASQVRDLEFKGKFRGIDPFVRTTNGLQRLSALNKDFASMFDNARNQIDQGWYYMLVQDRDAL